MVPAFHLHAHKPACQKYSHRLIEGLGMVAGENMENQWSQLGRKATMFRQMRLNYMHDYICISVDQLITEGQMQTRKLMCEFVHENFIMYSGSSSGTYHRSTKDDQRPVPEIST